MREQTPWTPEESQRLLDALQAGKSRAQAAKELGRTRNECISKANRLTGKQFPSDERKRTEGYRRRELREATRASAQAERDAIIAAMRDAIVQGTPRNKAIYRAHAQGLTLSTISLALQKSITRIRQIIMAEQARIL